MVVLYYIYYNVCHSYMEDIDPFLKRHCHSNIQMVGKQPLTTHSDHTQKHRFSLVVFNMADVVMVAADVQRVNTAQSISAIYTISLV